MSEVRFFGEKPSVVPYIIGAILLLVIGFGIYAYTQNKPAVDNAVQSTTSSISNNLSSMSSSKSASDSASSMSKSDASMSSSSLMMNSTPSSSSSSSSGMTISIPTTIR